MSSRFEGVFCSMVTPFKPNEELDDGAMRRHIEFQIGAGVHGLLFMGGCGEFLNLDDRERRRVMEIAVEQVNRRVPVIAGVLFPGTPDVCAFARIAKTVGVDAIMVLPPYYVSPSPPAVQAHYSRVADRGGLPIVVYNNPTRTNVHLDAEGLHTLAEIDAIIAIKDCDRNLASLSEKIHGLGHRIQILSGEDDLAFPSLLLGAKGGIWATTNLFPEMFVAMYEAALAGKVELARRYHFQMLPFWKACFVANHPGPLKEAMAMASRPVGKARHPLGSLAEEQIANVRSALARLVTAPEYEPRS